MGAQSVTTEVIPLDRPAPGPGEELNARMRIVSPGYFATLGVPVLRGRGIETADRRESQPASEGRAAGRRGTAGIPGEIQGARGHRCGQGRIIGA